MNENLDIFVFSHKDFKTWPNNPVYKLVSINDIKTDIPWKKILCDVKKDPILKMEHAYSEGARIHYIWKNYPLKEFVGTAHYRRYFDFFDKIPDVENIFKSHDAILPRFKLGWKSIYENYKNCHCIDDLNKVASIIKKEFPEFSDACDVAINNDLFVPCNIFILRKKMFNEWCEFVFGVLEKYDEMMGFKTDLDVYNHVVNNMEKYCEGKGNPNGYTFYQSRIQAFLMERLSTIFFIKRIKNPYMVDMVLTEVHDDFERSYFKIYEK